MLNSLITKIRDVDIKRPALDGMSNSNSHDIPYVQGPLLQQGSRNRCKQKPSPPTSEGQKHFGPSGLVYDPRRVGAASNSEYTTRMNKHPSYHFHSQPTMTIPPSHKPMTPAYAPGSILSSRPSTSTATYMPTPVYSPNYYSLQSQYYSPSSPGHKKEAKAMLLSPSSPNYTPVTDWFGSQQQQKDKAAHDAISSHYKRVQGGRRRSKKPKKKNISKTKGNGSRVNNPNVISSAKARPRPSRNVVGNRNDAERQRFDSSSFPNKRARPKVSERSSITTSSLCRIENRTTATLDQTSSSNGTDKDNGTIVSSSSNSNSSSNKRRRLAYDPEQPQYSSLYDPDPTGLYGKFDNKEYDPEYPGYFM